MKYLLSSMISIKPWSILSIWGGDPISCSPPHPSTNAGTHTVQYLHTQTDNPSIHQAYNNDQHTSNLEIEQAYWTKWALASIPGKLRLTWAGQSADRLDTNRFHTVHPVLFIPLL